MSDLSRRLRYLRRMCGVPQEAIAQHCGVTRTAVSLWEFGKAEPSASTVKALAEFFHMPAGWFFEPWQEIEDTTQAEFDRIRKKAGLSADELCSFLRQYSVVDIVREEEVGQTAPWEVIQRALSSFSYEAPRTPPGKTGFPS